METWYVVAVDKGAVLKFKNEGKEIPGVRLLLRGNEPASDPNDRYCGFNWLDQFISNDRLAKLTVRPMPGDTIQLLFNRYGDIVEINILAKEK